MHLAQKLAQLFGLVGFSGLYLLAAPRKVRNRSLRALLAAPVFILNVYIALGIFDREEEQLWRFIAGKRLDL